MSVTYFIYIYQYTIMLYIYLYTYYIITYILYIYKYMYIYMYIYIYIYIIYIYISFTYIYHYTCTYIWIPEVSDYFLRNFKGTIMHIEKTLINDDRLRVLKVFWNFRIPVIYNFMVIYPWNLIFSEKEVYFLRVSFVFFVYKQNFTASELKIYNSYEWKNFSVCYLC